MRTVGIGIDLGTYNSRVEVFQNGKVDIIPNEFGENNTPSYVAFTETQKLIGNEAKNKMKNNLKNTIYAIKKIIGHQFDDREAQNWPFKLVKDSNSDRTQIEISFQNEQKRFYIEELLAIELKKLKQIATDYIKKETKDVIIGIPACFTLVQKQILKDAALIAGFNKIGLINESALDSLAYGVYNQRGKEESVLAFDFGGGFLSVSLITLEDGLIEVWANYSENHLGGDHLDNKLVDYCEKELFSKTGLSFKNSQKALNRVRIECEKAKINLSSAKTAFIDIDSLMCGKDLYLEITRDKFEELCEDLFKKCIRVVEQVLKDGKRGKMK